MFSPKFILLRFCTSKTFDSICVSRKGGEKLRSLCSQVDFDCMLSERLTLSTTKIFPGRNRVWMLWYFSHKWNFFDTRSLWVFLINFFFLISKSRKVFQKLRKKFFLFIFIFHLQNLRALIVTALENKQTLQVSGKGYRPASVWGRRSHEWKGKCKFDDSVRLTALVIIAKLGHAITLHGHSFHSVILSRYFLSALNCKHTSRF